MTDAITTTSPRGSARAVDPLRISGLSVPVLGLGLLLETLSPRLTLLIFGLAVGLGILVAAPVLIGQPITDPTEPEEAP